MKELKAVGVREFREDLATYLQSDEPIAVTRHGQTVGIFIPTDHKQDEARRNAVDAAAERLSTFLEAHGITEDEVIDEFERLRREARAAGR